MLKIEFLLFLPPGKASLISYRNDEMCSSLSTWRNITNFPIIGTGYVRDAEIELNRTFLFHARNSSSFIIVIKKTLKLSVLSLTK